MSKRKTPELLTVKGMKILLETSRKESEYKIGQKIIPNNKMDDGSYSYVLEAAIGDVDRTKFDPKFSPREMLELGVFEGKYLNDCMDEFPKEWFEKALEKGKLSPEKADTSCNYFKINSRQPLKTWKENGWIPIISGDPDNRGWFQWYCRYYLGRRLPKLDAVQQKRWCAFKRHWGQVRKDPKCKSLAGRPRQRQALLQWSWDAFVLAATDEE